MRVRGLEEDLTAARKAQAATAAAAAAATAAAAAAAERAAQRQPASAPALLDGRVAERAAAEAEAAGLRAEAEALRRELAHALDLVRQLQQHHQQHQHHHHQQQQQLQQQHQHEPRAESEPRPLRDVATPAVPSAAGRATEASPSPWLMHRRQDERNAAAAGVAGAARASPVERASRSAPLSAPFSDLGVTLAREACTPVAPPPGHGVASWGSPVAQGSLFTASPPAVTPSTGSRDAATTTTTSDGSGGCSSGPGTGSPATSLAAAAAAVAERRLEEALAARDALERAAAAREARIEGLKGALAAAKLRAEDAEGALAAAARAEQSLVDERGEAAALRSELASARAEKAALQAACAAAEGRAAGAEAVGSGERARLAAAQARLDALAADAEACAEAARRRVGGGGQGGPHGAASALVAPPHGFGDSAAALAVLSELAAVRADAEAREAALEAKVDDLRARKRGYRDVAAAHEAEAGRLRATVEGQARELDGLRRRLASRDRPLVPLGGSGDNTAAPPPQSPPLPLPGSRSRSGSAGKRLGKAAAPLRAQPLGDRTNGGAVHQAGRM